jgi:beta-glucanase (GH16 family)
MEMGNFDGVAKNCSERFLSAGCHWGQTINGGHPSYNRSAAATANLQEGFHRYTLVRDERFIRMFLDDETIPYFEMNIAVYDGLFPVGNYFHDEFFVLFNLAAGGDFPQVYNIKNVSALNAANNYTASMYVNYVRVYDLEKNLVWNDEFNSLDETVWNIEVRDDGGGNRELQRYSRENVTVGPEPVTGNSCLILTARAE